MSLIAPSKPIFRGVVVATTGNVDQGRNGWSDADIQRYMNYWGGRFSLDLDASVTHLMALPEEVANVKKRPPQVKLALKLKKVTIVELDWLEDSIIRARKLPVTDYLLASGGRAIVETLKEKKKKEMKKKAREDEISKNYPHRQRFGTYSDETFFRYEITLTRGDKGERYQLTLCESFAKPHMYHVGRIYSESKGATLKYSRMAGPDAGVSFNAALNEFKDFFARKTGVQWDDRVDAFYKGKGKVASHEFVYELPTRGKPIGLVKGEVPDMDLLTGSNTTNHEFASDCKDDLKEMKEEQQENPTDTMQEAAGHDGSADESDEEDDVYPDDDGVMKAIDDTSNGGAAIATFTVPLVSAVADDANDSGVEEGNGTSNIVTGMGIGLDDEGYSSI